MGFQDQVIKFKDIELSKMTHKFDQLIKTDIKPFSFKSTQNKPISEIKYFQVYIRGVAEKVFDQLLWGIPEISKTSADFKVLFVESFVAAADNKMLALGECTFYPNFSEFAYRLKVKRVVMDQLNLTAIDQAVCQTIIGDIPEIIDQKCVLNFGPDYAEKSSADFAKEFPRWNKEIEQDLKLKNKKVS